MSTNSSALSSDVRGPARALGVGLVYWADLEPLLQPGGAAVSVVELEPQSTWELATQDDAWRYRCNDGLLDRVAALPQHKLLHGVGHPFGGTVRDPVDPLPLLRHAVDRLHPAWVSEHLSFNRRLRAGRVENAGFLLPPPQSPAAVRVAARNIAEFRRDLGRPVAFETGVNYLRPRPDDLPDGAFFAAVAHAADSGILLDLHNLWCNERNGRQPVAAALAQLPLERVWEIHVAGGMQESGYWLDAHSGAVPPQVLDIAAELIPRLPNLGALIFEVLPEHLSRIGLDGVHRQIEQLQPLWALRRSDEIRVAMTACEVGEPTPSDRGEVARWECALVDALRATPGSGSTTADLRTDAGCALLGELVREFRRASLVRALHYTMTCLLAGLGPRGTRELLEAYFEGHPPEPFAAVEADCFARFLLAQLPRLHVPQLAEVLAFERALVRATIHGVSTEVAWSVDPTQLFDSLDAGRLPPTLPKVSSRMRVCAR